jgi:hypothetical protein
MADVRIVEFEFPSGKKRRIEVLSAEEAKKPRADRPPRVARTNAHKHACKHVGAAIDVPAGCAGKQRGVWECAIYGQCMPLAQFRGTPSMPTCLYCASYEPSPDPSLLKQMKSAGDAAAKWIAAGRPQRSEERQAEIMQICEACPHIREGKAGQWCGVCGCWLKAKIAVATESCPLKTPRWTADVTSDAGRQ